MYIKRRRDTLTRTIYTKQTHRNKYTSHTTQLHNCTVSHAQHIHITLFLNISLSLSLPLFLDKHPPRSFHVCFMSGVQLYVVANCRVRSPHLLCRTLWASQNPHIDLRVQCFGRSDVRRPTVLAATAKYVRVYFVYSTSLFRLVFSLFFVVVCVGFI